METTTFMVPFDHCKAIKQSERDKKTQTERDIDRQRQTETDVRRMSGIGLYTASGKNRTSIINREINTRY